MPVPSREEVETAGRIMVWKDFVPQLLRFPLIILIIVVYMFSGGVYMSAAAEMVGSLSWISEDVMMAGYASMTGLTMAFPVLFRILFRFTVREFLLFSAGVFIVCDYGCMVCDFLPAVVFMSFASGFFKIAATFVCWSNVQLKITPRRDFAVFFPFLFTFVLGSVQLVNLATGYSIYAFDWKAMHRITIGAFIIISALVFFCMRRNYRQGPYVPFRGIDYIGGIQWTLLLFCIIFICVYGEHYDWLYGREIWTAAGFAAVLLFMCLNRARSIRHPYISPGTFSQRNMLYIFILFGCMTLMSATATSTQNIFTGQILGFDARHNADLNWALAVGIAVGTSVFFLAVTKWGWRTKSVVVAGFMSFFLYQISMYFLIDASAEKYMLYLPVLLKGAGVSMVYTSLTYALAGCVTFNYYFEAMCVIGFIRTSFGGPLSGAIVTRVFNHVQQDNISGMGSYIDMLAVPHEQILTVYGEFRRQVLMVSLKEVYGFAALAAIVTLVSIIASDYRHIPGNGASRMLKLAQVWKNVRRYTAAR